jgi:hypothetical protein
MTAAERWEMLASEFLRKLAKRDMAIWKARTSGLDACAENEPMPYETVKMIAEMKRVRRLNVGMAMRAATAPLVSPK